MLGNVFISATLFKKSALTHLRRKENRSTTFLTKESLRIRAEVCLEGAGKCSMASDGWSNPKPPGEVGAKS